MTKKMAVKKMTTKKKAVSLKNKEVYALMHPSNMKGPRGWMMSTDMKEHPFHAINSYLLHGGKEKDLKDLVVVKIEVVGKAIVNTVRNITIKK